MFDTAALISRLEGARGRTGTETRHIIEPRHVIRFAEAIGEANEVGVDGELGTQGGQTDITVPLTYPFTFTMSSKCPHEWLTSLGVEPSWVRHAEQVFAYSKPCQIGDEVLAQWEITEVLVKKAGALVFLTRRTRLETIDREPLADMDEVLAIRVPREKQ